MLSRNDQPNINQFNFGVDSVFTVIYEQKASVLPPISNKFLLLNATDFLLVGGGNFLLLG